MNTLLDGLKDLDAKIILQVHDELIIEVKEEQKEEAKRNFKKKYGKCSKIRCSIKS